MLSGSVCQMGQEAGLAGVAATDKRAQETPSSAAHTVHSGEELAAEGSHVSPPALNLGPSFEGKVAKPAKSQCTPRLVPTPSGNLLGPAPKPVSPSSSSLMPLPQHFTREPSHLLWVSEDRAAMHSSETLHTTVS